MFTIFSQNCNFLKCYMNWLSQFERKLGQNSQCVRGAPLPHFPTVLLYCTKIHLFCCAVNVINLNIPPYEKCYNKRVLVLSPLISFKSLVNKGGAGLSCDYADASTPHSLWVVRHFMKARISPSDPISKTQAFQLVHVVGYDNFLH